jgi:hypothetical protein
MTSRGHRNRFQLHESTQRGLCRLSFGLFGLLPLVCCLAFSAVQFLPAYHRWRAAAWEQWLSTQLGIEIELAAIENRAPDRWVLHGVRLLHPESGATLGCVPRVEVLARGGRWSVLLDEPELEGRQLTATWKMVHDWFLCRPQQYSRAAAIGANRLIIRGVDKTDEFSNIIVRMQPEQSELALDIQFRMSGEKIAAKKEPASLLKIRRNHTENRLMTNLQLQTATPLPCQLFHGLLPSTANFGEGATFTGLLDWQMRNAEWQLQLSDVNLQQVDFGNLGRWLGNKLSGRGMIYVHQATISNNHLETAVATIAAESGSISSDLLFNLAKHLDIELRQTNPVAVHAFESAFFTINIEPQWLQLAGRLPGDALLSDAIGPLARRAQERWGTSVPLAKLIDLLQDSDVDTDSHSQSVARGLSPVARIALRWLPLDAPTIHSPKDVTLR